MTDTPAIVPPESSSAGPSDVDRMRSVTRRSFATGGIAALAGVGGWTWLQTRPFADGIPSPFRQMHRFNEQVGRALFSAEHRAPEFPRSRAGNPRVNGRIGWQKDFPDAEGWRLSVEIPGAPARRFALSEMTRLPRTELVAEFKCVEGWSQVVQWSGWRFSDFLTGFGLLPPASAPFALLATPGAGYTAALDLPSLLHPQTLLCDTMNGEPLTPSHGAPLRLVLPVKYGIKNIKWLSSIRFESARSTDYWTSRGYDWYAGL